MDIIRVSPSPTFLSVLEELHTCPGAPKSVKNYFDVKEKITRKESEKPSQVLKAKRKKIIPDVKETTSNTEVEEKCSSEDLSCPELLLLPSDVKWCHERMRERGMKQRIHELLNESSISLPSYKPPPRNPELEARIVRLRNEQANRDYDSMTRNISKKQRERNSVTSVGNELREMHLEVNRQLVTGLQYIVSIIGTFFALFVGLSFALQDFAPRLVFSIIGALAVGLAEIYFIIREDIRAETLKKVN